MKSGNTRRGVFELLSLDLPRSSEPKGFDHVGIVVLLFALFVGPVVGSDTRLENQLVAFTGVLGDGFTQVAKCNKPQAGHNLPRIAVIVSAGVVVSDQTK